MLPFKLFACHKIGAIYVNISIDVLGLLVMTMSRIDATGIVETTERVISEFVLIF